MKRKILLTIAAVILSVIVFGTISVSADTLKYGVLHYVKDSNSISIIDCDYNATSVVIPEKIGDIPVTKIENNAFAGCSGFSEIEIPNSVKYIGAYAFRKCAGITSITIPDSVTYIGEYAFTNCKNLTNVVIGSGVIETGDFVFEKCSNLTTAVIIPKKIPKLGVSIFNYCSIKTIYYNGTKDEWNSVSSKYTSDYRKGVCFRYVTIIDTLNGSSIKEIYLENSFIKVSDIAKIFGKYIPTLYKDAEFTQEFDLSTPITENTILYAKGQTSTVCVTATTGEKIFITTPRAPENSTVILACYKDGKLVETKYALNKNETLYFIAYSDFDSAKIMVWDSLENMIPICEDEIVKL